MRTRTTSPALRGLLATVLFATGCHESVSPRRGRQGPEFWEVPAQALAFTVQPNNSTPCPSTIAPPVEVTAVDNQGQAVPDFTGDVTIAIGHDASAAGNATLSGTKTVAAVNGVARFGDLCIDQVGSGYMLQATSPGLTDATSTAFDITAAPPTTGDLIVTTTTTGSNLPTGYTVAVDDRPTQAIGANDHVTFSTLAAGDHSVTLVGVPSNCTVNEANPQKVSVPAGGTGHADFTISCVAPPPTTGDLVVTTTTTGSNLPAGYTVMVDNGQPQGIGTTGNVTYPGLAAADHMVALSVASNCTVSGTNPRTVSVPAGGTGHADFTIDCAPTTGELVVTTATTGSNLPAGYTVMVDNGQPKTIGTTGNVTYPGLAAADHMVALSVASNCTVSGANPRTVTVPAGGTGHADFTIDCAPTTGELVVTTATTGSNLPAGYTVMVDNGQPKTIGTTGNVTYPGLAAADHMVALSVASNCTVSGANPRTVTVPAGGTGHADFTIDCAPTTGELVVTTATTGANLPAGYTVTVDDRLQAIGINDRMTFPALAAGVHSVALSVASNCTVSGGSGRMVSVPAGGTAQVDFVIACAAPPPTLVFTQQPNDAVSNVSLAGSCTLPSTRGLPTTVSGQLTLQDNLGQTVNFTGHVTIQLGQNTGGGTLCGGPTLTFNLQNGVAEFNLSIAQGALETGTYTLVARATVQSSSLSVESVVFTISLVT